MYPFNNYLFIPISLMAEDGGPTKMMPSFWQSSANSAFSERKPYPGCMACGIKKTHHEYNTKWLLA